MVHALERIARSHPVVTRPVDRFHWMLGLRGALAFGGPMVVAHVVGAPLADAAVMSLAGLLIALVGAALPPGRRAVGTALGLIAVLPLIVALHALVDPHGAGQIVLVGAGGLVAGLMPLVVPSLALAARLGGIGIIVSSEVPATVRTAELMVAGGLIAVALLLATRPLAHPRVRLPRLPRPRPAATVEPADAVRHALRLAVTLAAVAAVALLIGHDTVFAARSSWMLLGVWIAMQPDRRTTTHLAVGRGLGTAVGAVATIVLVTVTPPALWLGWIFLVLAFVAFGLRSVNYAWYCVAVTPVIVVGFAGADLNREVLAARVVWTVVGVAVALAARLTLWPAESRAEPAPALA